MYVSLWHFLSQQESAWFEMDVSVIRLVSISQQSEFIQIKGHMTCALVRFHHPKMSNFKLWNQIREDASVKFFLFCFWFILLLARQEALSQVFRQSTDPLRSYLLSHYCAVNLQDTLYCVLWQHECMRGNSRLHFQQQFIKTPKLDISGSAWGRGLSGWV